MSTNLEPPDISVLRDRSRLDYYITALERWANLAKASGVSETLHADLVLNHAYKQNPDLCMEMSDNFNDTLKNDGEGIQKIISWLKAKFGMNWSKKIG